MQYVSGNNVPRASLLSGRCVGTVHFKASRLYKENLWIVPSLMEEQSAGPRFANALKNPTIFKN